MGASGGLTEQPLVSAVYTSDNLVVGTIFGLQHGQPVVPAGRRLLSDSRLLRTKTRFVRGSDRLESHRINTPLAYFLTFTCYGTWLHGDERGSVDQDHNIPLMPVLPPDPERHAREWDTLAEPPYHLDEPRRQVTLHALCEIARRKGWVLHAVHVRSNHVHIVVTAEGPPERVLNDFKTAASRRLNKAFPRSRIADAGRVMEVHATCGPRKLSRKRCITFWKGRANRWNDFPNRALPNRAAQAAQRSKRRAGRLLRSKTRFVRGSDLTGASHGLH